MPHVSKLPVSLNRPRPMGRVTQDPAPAPLADSAWFVLADEPNSANAVRFDVPPGALAGARCVWFDILLDGDWFVTFHLVMQAGEGGPTVRRQFSPLTQCQTRIAADFAGLDPAKIDRVLVTVIRKTDPPARFCLTAVTGSAEPPPRMTDPVLPRGPLVDEMGQSTLHDRAGRIRSVEAMVEHLRRRLDQAPAQRPPASFSRWGGWKDRRVEGTGFFRTHHDGRRWWLVDPEGYLFWSSGLDCTHPTIDHETYYETADMDLRKALRWMPDPQGPYASSYHTNPYHSPQNREINYVQANFIRAFGPERWHEAWAAVAFAELRRLGFNTAGDWSDEAACSAAGVPYVRPMDLVWRFPSVRAICGVFPDAFDPAIETDVAAMAETLRPTAGDPAMIGYFLTNEPSVGWCMDPRGALAGAMLRRTTACHSRRALADFLRTRYGDSAGLSAAWGMTATLEAVAEGPWTAEFTDAACADLRAFSTVLLRRLLQLASDAARKVDPNHLNLGIRWWTFPPCWALEAMHCLDVISYNYYQPKVAMVPYGQSQDPRAEGVLAALNRPVLIGEWHMGALDGGLPSAGLLRVADQESRGKAFRVYVEHAAALPWCVGAHWFNLYDRNALSGPSSNENYNIGFVDLCHNPHEPICRAARATHERLYALAAGEIQPYDEPVELLWPSR